MDYTVLIRKAKCSWYFQQIIREFMQPNIAEISTVQRDSRETVHKVGKLQPQIIIDRQKSIGYPLGRVWLTCLVSLHDCCMSGLGGLNRVSSVGNHVFDVHFVL